jgi:predicted HicB family RNase H-like nuclease
MKENQSPGSKQQMGVRIDTALLVEAKVLAARQQRRLNEVVEEALHDLLKKYREKRRDGR